MIAIIRYGAGNTRSVQNALTRLGVESCITSDPAIIGRADKVILPGVGEAAFAMQSLVATGLDVLIPRLQQPVLGICLGMQLLCSASEEGNTRCLGIISTTVKKFPAGFVVPHTGWNELASTRGSLFAGMTRPDVYFVHSYYVPLCAYTIAEANYIHPFSAAIQKDNFYATQFHPEKSGNAGETILNNFLRL